MLGNENQTYLVHPQEWRLWVLLFVASVCLRVLHEHRASSDRGVHVSSTPSWSTAELFESVYSRYGVQQTVTYDYCLLDSQILCGYPSQQSTTTGECDDVFGYPLSTFLRSDVDHPREDEDSMTEPAKNCTLLNHSPLSRPGAGVETTEEEEKKIVVAFFDYAWELLELTLDGNRFDEEEKYRFIEFYFGMFFCLFGYQPNLDGSITDREDAIFLSNPSLWTAAEFFRLLRLSLDEREKKLLARKNHLDLIQNGDPTPKKPLEYKIEGRPNLTVATPHAPSIHLSNSRNEWAATFVRLLNLAHNNLQTTVFKSINPGEWVCSVATNQVHYKAPYRVFVEHDTDSCMVQLYHAKKSPLSRRCRTAIEGAFWRMEELELEEGGGFMEISHAFFTGVNLTSLLILFMLLTSKQRLERRMDRGRQRLQQELNDPFLRESLERKAAKLPEEERLNLILRLENKIANWDSKAAARKLLRRYARLFRLVLLLTMALTTIVYFVLHLFGNSSFPLYLEITAMSSFMLAASYKAEIGEPEQRLVKEVMMTDVSRSTTNLDPSSTQALLDHDGPYDQPEVAPPHPAHQQEAEMTSLLI